jgi:hypothetical protein
MRLATPSVLKRPRYTLRSFEAITE